MNSFTDSQKYMLDTWGFVVCRNAIKSPNLESIIALVNNIVTNTSIPHLKYDFIRHNPVFSQLLSHEWVMDGCRTFMGEWFRFDHAFGIHQQAGTKGANLHGGPFCCQNSCFYTNIDGKPKCGRVSVGIALSHQSPKTGGVCFIPGSHKAGSTTGGADLLRNTLKNFDHEAIYTPTLNPGDIYFFPDCLVHGTSPWLGEHPRNVLYYMYSPGYMAWKAPDDSLELPTTYSQLLEPPYVSQWDDEVVNNWRSPTIPALSIWRIIGNELPPRDNPGVKLRTLEFICKHIESVPTRWLINHIVDLDYKSKVIGILKAYNQEYVDLPFDAARYALCTDKNDKIRQLININAARNYCIKNSSSRYTACLDQDCWLPPDMLRVVLESVKTHSDYYLLSMKRVTLDTIDKHQMVPSEEPQLIVSNTAKHLYDENRIFGHDDKMALLNQVVDLCKHGGEVLHLDELPPPSQQERVALRQRSIDMLIEKTDTKVPNKRLRLL